MAELLTAKLAGPIAAGVAALLLAALVYVGLNSLGKNRTIATLKDAIHNPKTGYIVRLAAAESNYGQCSSNRITLEEATKRQNEAVAKAAEAGRARAAELDAIAADYRKSLERTNALVASILNLKGTGDHCADAEHLIREQVR